MHPLWLRLTHWLNALAMLIMVTSGWRIYNASPLFNFSFLNELTLGGWLGGALQWHFAGMWLFGVNGLCYLLINRPAGVSNASIGRSAHGSFSPMQAPRCAAGCNTPTCATTTWCNAWPICR